MNHTQQGVDRENWFLACQAEDVPHNGGVCVKRGDEQIALFYFARTNQWYASQNLCPHRHQMALSRGMTGSVGPDQQPKVACPFHKKTFSLNSGKCLSGEDYQIKVYPVKVEDGNVYIGYQPLSNTEPVETQQFAAIS
ncbi:nitrite reductase small subunit NirD [Arachidicoccus ginsenosidivorans]|jgi:nitrite reductase (NADH) small subunit|uniref:Nitrite reductase small subunit NirD n=1 Tax=Arachidicoccus ginsenosidivorans TaxID=496057 RepID=A0A5B8VQN0_9BACT|nr:nitrite reductase small subunit NirD [Arachidicoccus ginsenosidivorans]QEC72905.1 nitrite reductase small subunit NirD [Arachidicoccus ginsenosidivorans]